MFLETAANPYVTELGSKETATSRLNLSQSFNGLGGIFATFCIGQFLFNNTEEGGNVVVPYAILGVLVLAIAVVFSRVNLPEISHEQTSEDKERGSNIRKLFTHHKMFVFGLFALLSYEVAEISINSYFINFVTGMHWMSDRTASLVLTGALAFFMVGRFLGSWVMRHVAATTMLPCLCCGLRGVQCLGLVLFRQSVFGGIVVQLSLRGYHVPHHLLDSPCRIGQSYQERLLASDDDPYRWLWLPSDGAHCRPHPCGDAFCGALGRLCRCAGLCRA